MKTTNIGYILAVIVILAVGIFSLVKCSIPYDTPVPFVSEPLTTQAAVNAFAVGTLNLTCDRDDFVFQTTDELPMPSEQFQTSEGEMITLYGYKGVGTGGLHGFIAFSECLWVKEWQTIIINGEEKTVPKSGTFAFRLELDPNNKWIKTQVCNPEAYGSQCDKIESINRNLPDNPDYKFYRNLTIIA